jgi:hypothetical protein
MDLQKEVEGIRQQGIEFAASLWEMLELLPQPFQPVNIFKAACSVKCAEFLSRVRDNPLYPELSPLISRFMEETINIVGRESANQVEGFKVVEFFEKEMPLTQEIFEDAAAYAQRQHVYDGMIMLAAARMGKEEETKKCLTRLQKGCVRVMIMALFVDAMKQAGEESPEDE